MNVRRNAQNGPESVDSAVSDTQAVSMPNDTQGADSDDRRDIWLDLLHLEAAIWSELREHDELRPPPWRRLTRRQLMGAQRRMVGLVTTLRELREEATDD